MQKELIYDKMNGFLTDGLPSLAEGTVVEDEFAEGKECALSQFLDRAHYPR